MKKTFPSSNVKSARRPRRVRNRNAARYARDARPVKYAGISGIKGVDGGSSGGVEGIEGIQGGGDRQGKSKKPSVFYNGREWRWNEDKGDYTTGFYTNGHAVVISLKEQQERDRKRHENEANRPDDETWGIDDSEKPIKDAPDENDRKICSTVGNNLNLGWSRAFDVIAEAKENGDEERAKYLIGIVVKNAADIHRRGFLVHGAQEALSTINEKLKDGGLASARDHFKDVAAKLASAKPEELRALSEQLFQKYVDGNGDRKHLTQEERTRVRKPAEEKRVDDENYIPNVGDESAPESQNKENAVDAASEEEEEEDDEDEPPLADEEDDANFTPNVVDEEDEKEKARRDEENKAKLEAIRNNARKGFIDGKSFDEVYKSSQDAFRDYQNNGGRTSDVEFIRDEAAKYLAFQAVKDGLIDPESKKPYAKFFENEAVDKLKAPEEEAFHIGRKADMYAQFPSANDWTEPTDEDEVDDENYIPDLGDEPQTPGEPQNEDESQKQEQSEQTTNEREPALDAQSDQAESDADDSRRTRSVEGGEVGYDPRVEDVKDAFRSDASALYSIWDSAKTEYEDEDGVDDPLTLYKDAVEKLDPDDALGRKMAYNQALTRILSTATNPEFMRSADVESLYKRTTRKDFRDALDRKNAFLQDTLGALAFQFNDDPEITSHKDFWQSFADAIKNDDALRNAGFDFISAYENDLIQRTFEFANDARSRFARESFKERGKARDAFVDAVKDYFQRGASQDSAQIGNEVNPSQESASDVEDEEWNGAFDEGWEENEDIDYPEVEESAPDAEADAQALANDKPIDAETRAGAPSGHKPEPGMVPGRPDKPVKGEMYSVNIKDLKLDPERFQFKLDVNPKTGVTDVFEGTKFNPELAGDLLLWRDPADGNDYVVNGHHRFQLAKKSGYEGNFNVKYADVKTAEEAKVEGAIVNIAEGKGTSVDAADIMRLHQELSREYLESRGVSFKMANAREGELLAKLHEDVFKAVKTGELKPNFAAKIAEILPDDQQKQVELFEKFIKPKLDADGGKKLTLEDVEAYALAYASVQGQQRDASTGFMFDLGVTYGDEIEARCELIKRVKKAFGDSKKAHASLARGKNAQLLEGSGAAKEIDVDSAKGERDRASSILNGFNDAVRNSTPFINQFADKVREYLNAKTNEERERAVNDAINFVADYDYDSDVQRRWLPTGDGENATRNDWTDDAAVKERARAATEAQNEGILGQSASGREGLSDDGLVAPNLSEEEGRRNAEGRDREAVEPSGSQENGGRGGLLGGDDQESNGDRRAAGDDTGSAGGRGLLEESPEESAAQIGAENTASDDASDSFFGASEPAPPKRKSRNDDFWGDGNDLFGDMGTLFEKPKDTPQPADNTPQISEQPNEENAESEAASREIVAEVNPPEPDPDAASGDEAEAQSVTNEGASAENEAETASNSSATNTTPKTDDYLKIARDPESRRRRRAIFADNLTRDDYRAYSDIEYNLILEEKALDNIDKMEEYFRAHGNLDGFVAPDHYTEERIAATKGKPTEEIQSIIDSYRRESEEVCDFYFKQIEPFSQKIKKRMERSPGNRRFIHDAIPKMDVGVDGKRLEGSYKQKRFAQKIIDYATDAIRNEFEELLENGNSSFAESAKNDEGLLRYCYYRTLARLLDVAPEQSGVPQNGEIPTNMTSSSLWIDRFMNERWEDGALGEESGVTRIGKKDREKQWIRKTKSAFLSVCEDVARERGLSMNPNAEAPAPAPETEASPEETAAMDVASETPSAEAEPENVDDEEIRSNVKHSAGVLLPEYSNVTPLVPQDHGVRRAKAIISDFYGGKIDASEALASLDKLDPADDKPIKSPKDGGVKVSQKEIQSEIDGAWSRIDRVKGQLREYLGETSSAEETAPESSETAAQEIGDGYTALPNGTGQYREVNLFADDDNASDTETPEEPQAQETKSTVLPDNEAKYVPYHWRDNPGGFPGHMYDDLKRTVRRSAAPLLQSLKRGGKPNLQTCILLSNMLRATNSVPTEWTSDGKTIVKDDGGYYVTGADSKTLRKILFTSTGKLPNGVRWDKSKSAYFLPESCVGDALSNLPPDDFADVFEKATARFQQVAFGDSPVPSPEESEPSATLDEQIDSASDDEIASGVSNAPVSKTEEAVADVGNDAQDEDDAPSYDPNVGFNEEAHNDLARRWEAIKRAREDGIKKQLEKDRADEMSLVSQIERVRDEHVSDAQEGDWVGSNYAEAMFEYMLGNPSIVGLRSSEDLSWDPMVSPTKKDRGAAKTAIHRIGTVNTVASLVDDCSDYFVQDVPLKVDGIGSVVERIRSAILDGLKRDLKGARTELQRDEALDFAQQAFYHAATALESLLDPAFGTYSEDEQRAVQPSFKNAIGIIKSRLTGNIPVGKNKFVTVPNEDLVIVNDVQGDYYRDLPPAETASREIASEVNPPEPDADAATGDEAAAQSVAEETSAFDRGVLNVMKQGFKTFFHKQGEDADADHVFDNASKAIIETANHWVGDGTDFSSRFSHDSYFANKVINLARHILLANVPRSERYVDALKKAYKEATGMNPAAYDLEETNAKWRVAVKRALFAARKEIENGGDVSDKALDKLIGARMLQRPETSEERNTNESEHLEPPKESEENGDEAAAQSVANESTTEDEFGEIPEEDSSRLAEYRRMRQSGDGYYSVSEDAARSAKRTNSFDDYEEGSVTAGYRAEVDKMRAKAADAKKRLGTEYHDKIDGICAAYERKLADWVDRFNRNRASCPNVMISGAGNFPVDKKRKQNARHDALMTERYGNVGSKKEGFESYYAHKLESIGTGGIRSNDPNAAEKLQKELEAQKTVHSAMLDANKYWRKHKTMEGWEPSEELGLSQRQKTTLINVARDNCGRYESIQPFHSSALSNSNAEIKRLQGRIESLKRNAAVAVGEGGELAKFDGGTVVYDKGNDRLQLKFDGVPSEEVRSQLKHSGWRWSGKNKAWQRHYTQSAIYSAKNLGYLPKDWKPEQEAPQQPEDEDGA